eukprot:COSAG05_NODE_2612_length_2837_cov_2.529584_2_plen_85_part_00
MCLQRSGTAAADSSGGMSEGGYGEGDPLYKAFARYDQTRTGSLSKYEVKEMMVALGYTAKEDYLQGLIDLYGKFDANGAPSVSF